MTDPVGEFFNGLAERGFEPLLQHNSGSIRFDVMDAGEADRWLVTIDRGTVAIGRDDATADTVVTLERAVLVDAIRGKQNLVIALWLGQVGMSGDSERLISFQRLFARQPEPATAQADRR